MNKVKSFFQVELGASEESADISKIRDKISIPLAFQKLWHFLYEEGGMIRPLPTPDRVKLKLLLIRCF